MSNFQYLMAGPMCI